MADSQIASLTRCKCGQWTRAPWTHIGCEVVIRGSLVQAPKFDALPKRTSAPKRRIVERIVSGAKTLLKLQCGHVLVRYPSRGAVAVVWARCSECHSR